MPQYVTMPQLLKCSLSNQKLYLKSSESFSVPFNDYYSIQSISECNIADRAHWFGVNQLSACVRVDIDSPLFWR